MRTLHTTPRAVVLLDVPTYPLLCSLSQCPTVKRSQLIEKCLNDFPPPITSDLRSQISVALLQPPPRLDHSSQLPRRDLPSPPVAEVSDIGRPADLRKSWRPSQPRPMSQGLSHRPSAISH